MSALFTALVEGETKETLAASLLEHRAALRKAKVKLLPVDGELVDEIDRVLDTMVFREAGNRDRCEVSVCTNPGFCDTDQRCPVCAGRTPECAFGGCRRS
jgi:hypothetical protein